MNDTMLEAIISYSHAAEQKADFKYLVSGVAFPLLFKKDPSLECLWTLGGSDIPSYVYYLPDSLSWLIGASCIYTKPDVSHEVAVQKTPTYTWTQDPECCTIWFPLAHDVKPGQIKVSFSTNHLSVLIQAASKQSNAIHLISHRRLFSPIDAQLSTWSTDSSTLRVVLEKPEGDQGPRWEALFADASLDDPVETFSPEHLQNMAGVLAHMTQDEVGARLSQTPALLYGDGEEEEELDSSQSNVTTHFTLLVQSGNPEECGAGEILSYPLPTANSMTDNSIVIKRSYDGLLYDPLWAHSSTYPALAYVLASKRSLSMRFVAHCAEKYCLAIESGSNVWCYWPPPPADRAKTASQAVIRLDDDLGAILGVGAIDDLVILLSRRGLTCIKGLSRPSSV